MNGFVVSILRLTLIVGALHQLPAQSIVWESATRSASPEGADASLAYWHYSAPAVIGRPSLPWLPPPTDVLAVHDSAFHSSGVDIDLSAKTSLWGGLFTGERGRAAFQAAFTVSETTVVDFLIEACQAMNYGNGTDVTESFVKLSLLKQGDARNLLQCAAADTPQRLSLTPGRYELSASVSPQLTQPNFIIYSVLRLSMKVADGRTPPPVRPHELVAPQLELSGTLIRVLVPESVVGRRYQLQVSATALDGSWNDIGVTRSGDGGPLAFETRMRSSSGDDFFRVALDPP
jgi:hypothetical protein